MQNDIKTMVKEVGEIAKLFPQLTELEALKVAIELQRNEILFNGLYEINKSIQNAGYGG
jgi:hypothetical protein